MGGPRKYRVTLVLAYSLGYPPPIFSSKKMGEMRLEIDEPYFFFFYSAVQSTFFAHCLSMIEFIQNSTNSSYVFGKVPKRFNHLFL